MKEFDIITLEEIETAIYRYLLKSIISNNGYEKTTLKFNEDCSMIDVYVYLKPSIECINVNYKLKGE